MHQPMPVLIVAAALLAATPAFAQQAPAARIIVMGEGENAVAPDIALLSLGVMHEAATARQALDATSSAMTDVIETLKAEGIAARDLQTGGLQISPRYTYTNKPDGSQQADLVGYQVTNILSVRVRDIAKAGEIVDKAVARGVNQGADISFANDDPSKAVAEARQRAVADAFSKARALSGAAGVRLGRVLEISDQNFPAPPAPIAAKAFDRAAATPIEAGENAYKVQVTVTFELR